MADAVNPSLEDIYTTLGDFSAVSETSDNYTPVTSAAIQFGSSFLTFDVITERKHIGDTAVTEHPVEDGPDVTDHVRPAPYQIDLDAFISNEPIVGGVLTSTALNPAMYTPPLAPTPGAAFAAVGQGLTALSNAIFGAPSYNAQIMTFDTPFDAVADTLVQLQQFHDDSTILTLITAECTYDNVVMTHFELDKTHDTGSGASCSMSFKVLNVVETSVVAAPTPAVVRGAVAQNMGVQAPKVTANPPIAQEVSQYTSDAAGILGI